MTSVLPCYGSWCSFPIVVFCVESCAKSSTRKAPMFSRALLFVAEAWVLVSDVALLLWFGVKSFGAILGDVSGCGLLAFWPLMFFDGFSLLIKCGI